MRIVTVLTSLGMGGAEKQAQAVAERMAKRGHDVALLVLKPPVPDEWPTSALTIHLNMRKSPFSLLSASGRRAVFCAISSRTWFTATASTQTSSRGCSRLRVPSIPVLSTVHNVYEGGPLRMLAYQITDGLSRCTVAVSRAAGDRFVSLKAIPKRKCLVIANGIDAMEFTPSAERRGLMRTTMGAASRFIWFAAGRLVAAKDFPNLLRAFRQARSEFPDAELWIAGAPADPKLRSGRDGASRYLSLMAVERGCEENVQLAWPAPRYSSTAGRGRWVCAGLGLGRDAAVRR